MNKVFQNWPYFYFKASFKSCFLLLILLAFSLPCHAGIFSALSKIGKTINNGDISIPLNKIELPHDIGNHTTSHIKLNADNEWHITHKDGTTTPIDNLPQQNSKNTALIIQKSDLPKSLHQLDNLPDNMPVFIQGKQGRLFKYQRGKPATLKYKNVLLQVASMDEVLDGLWLLQRPPVNRSPRFVQIDDRVRSTPPSNAANSNLDVESISAESLINSMHSFKYQTLILSGKIIDGRLTGQGRNASGVSLKKLKQLASDKDINLFPNHT